MVTHKGEWREQKKEVEWESVGQPSKSAFAEHMLTAKMKK